MGLDWSVLLWFESIRTPVGDVVAPFLGMLGEFGWIWIALAAVLLAIPSTRRVGVVVVVALLLDLLVVDLAIKNIVARPRPFEVSDAIVPLMDPPWGHSFPSGHAAAAFATVSALYFSHCRVWMGALPLAILIALSRLYVFVHYPSDVLAGVLIGAVLGWVAAWLVGRPWRDSGT